MTSQAQARRAVAPVCGLAFFGFPLHASGKPSSDRGDHLKKIDIPMLFLQGEKRQARGAFAVGARGEAGLGKRATLCVLPAADHLSFHVPARSGRYVMPENPGDGAGMPLPVGRGPLSASRTRA